MDAHLDTGDILYQVRVETRSDDSVNSLYERVMTESVALVPRLLDNAQNNCIPRRPQGSEGASYFSKTTDEDFHLQWNWPAEKLARWVTITPGKCFFKVDGDRYFVLDAAIVSGNGQPGTILSTKDGCQIAAGHDALRIDQVRTASGQVISLADYCRQKGITRL
jgi:methionyl-tRNA formyltransferase